VSHFFDDDLVCASVGVHANLVRGIEPFPTAELRSYDPGYVAGWVVERYQIDLAGAAERARAAMNAKLESLCVAADPRRHLPQPRVRADWSGQTYKHILAPAWLLSYDYGRRAFQCAINGVTGKVDGEYPKSAWKIALIVLAVIVLVIVFGAMSGAEGSSMKAVILTGVSRGLGAALAHALVERGVDVLGVGRSGAPGLESGSFSLARADLADVAGLDAALGRRSRRSRRASPRRCASSTTPRRPSRWGSCGCTTARRSRARSPSTSRRPRRSARCSCACSPTRRSSGASSTCRRARRARRSRA
jgi:hypothetical protein